jgi:hypothetical protein
MALRGSGVSSDGSAMISGRTKIVKISSRARHATLLTTVGATGCYYRQDHYI